MPAFEPEQSGDLLFPMSFDDIVGRECELKVVGVALDDVLFDSVDHLQGTICRVIAVDVLGPDIDGEEDGAYASFFEARDIRLISGSVADIHAVDGEARDVVMSIDQQSGFGDGVDLPFDLFRIGRCAGQ